MPPTATSQPSASSAPSAPSSSSLPIIDISPFLDPARAVDKPACADRIRAACRDVGFFYLIGHGVPKETIEGVLDLSREFFNRPDEEKQAISIARNDKARGYQRLGENITRSLKDWHEGLDLCKPVSPDHYLARNNLPMGGENPWPVQPEGFRATFEDYIERLQVVGRAMMRGIAISLNLDEAYFEPMVNDSFWYLRCIGYPPLQGAMNADRVGISCGEHTDYGCLTFLNQDSIRGALQVQTKSGDWANADPVPGAFVVNIGDMLNIWTGGLYKSTLHRVIHKGTDYRVSVPFFFEPNFDAKISPLPGVGDGEKEYKEVVYGEHLMRKVTSNFEIVQG